MADLKAAAQEYWDQGLNIVLMTVLEDGRKTALHDWKQWQTQRQTREEFDALPWLNAERFAVVCGVKGSNGLFFCAIDTDNTEFDGTLLRVTQTERTPRGGLHFVYWSRVNARGKKLHDLKIELLGQGNLCLMYPSKDYVKLNDNLPTEIDDINEVFQDLAEKLGGHAEWTPIDIHKLLEGVSHGERGDSAIQISVYYRRKGLNQEQVLEKLRKWNRKNVEPLQDMELTRTVESAFKTEEPYAFRFTDDVEKRKRKQYKDSCLNIDGCFEAVYHKGNPAFLVRRKDGFGIVDSLEVNEETFYPKDVKRIPYEPYGYYEQVTPSREELFLKVKREFQAFVDVEPIWRDVLSACVLLTYHQEKLQTVPYLFLYGDNESGKSTVLQVLKFLCYRPMYGVTIPSADLYGYLEDSEGAGCILEDEVQGIHKDTDKIKIYKAGYKQGAVVPRTLITQHDRIIKYYQTFCFKACASEQIAQVKGFNERFLFIAMVEGCPEKEWADITREDLDRLHNLRNMLLKWRLESRTLQLPEIQMSVKGRVKELWKPLLQITQGLTVYDGLFKFVEDQKNERLSDRQNTLEGHVVKVVSSLYNQGNETIPFSDIWRELGYDLDGKLDDKKPHVMDTSEFFQVTKNKVGYRLREVLSGKSKPIREKDSEGNNTVVKAYVFDPVKLRRVAKKYGYELVTKLPSLPSSERAEEPFTMENTMEKQPFTPLELGKLSNSVTSGKEPFGLLTEDSSISKNSIKKSITRNKEPNSVTERLFQCQYCKANKKQSFFSTEHDLRAHISAYHETDSGYVR